jgi:hypothetical protein
MKFLSKQVQKAYQKPFCAGSVVIMMLSLKKCAQTNSIHLSLAVCNSVVEDYSID